jgi:hypothetical protein
MILAVAKYTFLSPEEPPSAARSRRLRMALNFCLTIGAVILFGILWRRYHPGDAQGVVEDVFDGVIAVAVGIMQGEGTKASAEKVRREFRLSLDSEQISRERPALTLLRRDIKAIYMGPWRSLWITSIYSPRKIIVPGTLEGRDSLLRDLAGIGLPLKTFSDWFTDFAGVRALAMIVVCVAWLCLWFPGPVWRSGIAAIVLLAGSAWYWIRAAQNPDVEHVGLEKLCILLLVLGPLWRDAHLLFGVWP